MRSGRPELCTGNDLICIGRSNRRGIAAGKRRLGQPDVFEVKVAHFGDGEQKKHTQEILGLNIPAAVPYTTKAKPGLKCGMKKKFI